MIRRKEECPQEIMVRMKAGNGEFRVEHLVGKEVLGTAGRLFAKGILKPGHSVGWHVHDKTEMEVCYILSGMATILDDGSNPVKLLPGDTHVCLPGSGHSIVNEETEDLEYLAVVLFPELN